MFINSYDCVLLLSKSVKIIIIMQNNTSLSGIYSSLLLRVLHEYMKFVITYSLGVIVEQSSVIAGPLLEISVE